jgi:hypothetical protein
MKKFFCILKSKMIAVYPEDVGVLVLFSLVTLYFLAMCIMIL